MKNVVTITAIFCLLAMSPVFANSDIHISNSILVASSDKNSENGSMQVDQDPDTLGDVYRRIPSTPHWNMIPAEGYEQIDVAVLTFDDLLGADVYDEIHQTIANVSDVLLGPDGQVDRLIIDVGGFLGIGAKSVAFDADELEFYKGPFDDLRVYIPMTEDEVRDKPEYTE